MARSCWQCLQCFVVALLLTFSSCNTDSTSRRHHHEQQTNAQSQTVGHWMVNLGHSLSFILCSTTQRELDSSQLRLINLNDVVLEHNSICVQSSLFDLSAHALRFQPPLTMTKLAQSDTNSLDRARKHNLIEIRSLSNSNNCYHFKFERSYLSISFLDQETRRIPSSPSLPSFALSKVPLNFTFVPVSESPFTESSALQFTTDVSSTGLYDVQHMNEVNRMHPKIGKRVKLGDRVGVISNYVSHSNSFEVQFNDGDIAYVDNIDFSQIHIEYAIGSRVDAYWPPDRLKLTNLADVLWPAVISNYSNLSDSYTLKYEDGAVHANIPSIYIKYPQMQCKDTREDCPVLAKNQQCQSNPSFTLIHCRKSCRVCMPKQNEKEEEIGGAVRSSAPREAFEYFKVRVDGDTSADVSDVSDSSDISMHYEQHAAHNLFDEARSLNEIGEQLMLYGNISVAEEYFLRASFLGNNEAKFNLAHIYSIGGRDDGAVLYLYFAALAGSLESNLALGYRHLYGYGVPKTCQIAAEYYQRAANTLFGSNHVYNPMEQQHIEMVRLHDVSRRDLPIKETDEVIRFYHSHADNGDAHAQMALGQLYYYGLRGFDQNFNEALNYFQLAAAQNHGDAYSMLGNIYVDGIEQLQIAKNVSRAVEYYQKAIAAKSVSGHTGMAFLYLEGIPDDKDASKLVKNATAAFEHFKYAAKRQDLAATFYLGLMYFNGIGVKQKSFADAFECFMRASQRGHPQSLYYAGYMHLNGLVTAKSCKMAVELFKMAAERTVIAKQLATARAHYLDAEYNKAYYLYSKLAIMGFEIAQSNVGWLLKRNLVAKQLLYLDGNETGDANKTLKQLSRKAAFPYFEWSATQSNADSQRIVGDYYYYDYLSTGSASHRYEEAGNYYEMSAENTLGANAQSMFNLGYMHQYGIGRKQDFEMAKRYYDLSKQTDADGNVACYIFLCLLYAEKFVYDLQANGRVNVFGLDASLTSWNLHGNLAYYTSWARHTYHQYTHDLDLENVALILLILILIVVLWLRQ